MTAWMFDFLPDTFDTLDPFTVAAVLGGFMALIAYFQPKVGLVVFDLFFPPTKSELAPSSTTVLTSLQKRQLQTDKLNEWNDLNTWSINHLRKKDIINFRQEQNKMDEALRDLIGRKPRVIAAIAQRIRNCVEATPSSVGNLDPFVAKMMDYCGWTENSQTDPIQFLVVFVGAVWNPSCRNTVLDLKEVRGQFKDTPSIAFAFAPIPEGKSLCFGINRLDDVGWRRIVFIFCSVVNLSCCFICVLIFCKHLHMVQTRCYLPSTEASETQFAITKDMVATPAAQAAMASAIGWAEAKCDPSLHAHLVSLSGGIVSPEPKRTAAFAFGFFLRCLFVMFLLRRLLVVHHH